MQRTWNVTQNDTDFEYLSKFVEIISNLTLERIYTVFDFGDDDRLRYINLRDLVAFVRNYLHFVKFILFKNY